MADQDFMSKLDTATDGKAVEIMETLNNDLDARKLEDTSTDTVKASRGKEFKPLTPEEFKDQQIKLSQAVDINNAAAILGLEQPTANKSNRKQKQKENLEFIKKGKIGSVVFRLSSLGNFGRVFKGKGKNKTYLLNNGEYVKIGSKKYKKAQDVNSELDFVAAGVSLYYGVNDPAYIKAKEASLKNDLNPLNKSFLELSKGKFPITKVAIPTSGIITPAWFKRNKPRFAKNMEALDLFSQILQEGVHKNGGSLNSAALMLASAYQATGGIIKIAAAYKYTQDSKTFRVW